MRCSEGSSRRLAWASTSAAASIIVSATATHPQEQDTAQGAAMELPEVSLYARVHGTRRRCATRRRSRRAASRATARRATQITRSIMMNGRTAHTVPATHSVGFLELSGPHHLCAEHGASHHGLRDDISRQGES
jgi:hypothetical protein